jgi:MFS transporter, DHA1 family, multidrug resistance protein
MNASFRSTLILSIVAFFVMLGVAIISPVLPAYGLSFGVGFALVGLLMSGFGLARFFLDIPVGLVCDRVGIKRFMLIGLAVIVAGSLVAAFAIDYWMLLAGRILEGVGSAIYSTTSLTAVSRVAPREKRGAYMSLYVSMFLLGSVFGPVVGGFSAELFGINSPFIVYGLVAAVSFVLVLSWIKEQGAMCVAPPAITARQFGRLLKDYDIFSINAATFAVFVTRQGILGTIVPLFAINNLRLTVGELGVILTLSAVCNLSTMLIAGKLTDRYGRKPFMMISLILTGVFILMMPLATNIVGVALLLMALGFVIGLSGPIAAWVTDVSRPEDLPAALGLFRTMGDLGFVIAPIVLATLAGDQGSPVSILPFIVAGVWITLTSALLIRTRDPITKGEGPEPAD